MRELLDLRMRGVQIEEATSWLEKDVGQDRSGKSLPKLRHFCGRLPPQFDIYLGPARAIDWISLVGWW